MRVSISIKWFLWLSLTLALFCMVQVMAMLWLESREIWTGKDSWREERGEVAVLSSISLGTFVLMSGVMWFISRGMVRLYRRGTQGYYTGTLSPDRTFIRGSASWYPPGAFWTARISGR